MRSAGILLFRRTSNGPEFFLVHPGGPFFARKDLGAWSLPKGEITANEDPFAVARREFEEETGQSLAACTTGQAIPLGTVRQASGKVVEAWAVEGDWPNGKELVSNTFTLEWPPGSGRTSEFPEVDRGEFFPLDVAKTKLNAAQAAFLERWLEHETKQSA
jgi:predicted NUDIX family NTP pyrophosphohydrolase